MARKFLLIETDGKVYLEEREGRLDLPTATSRLPFKVVTRPGFKVEGAEVLYAKPELDRHPEEWLDKDLIPSMDEASSLARAAVLATMHRLVTNAIILDGDRVLLVKANRGFAAGWWNVPGGFVEWDESPDECLRRELREELGIDVQSAELLTVETHKFERSPYYMMAFVYLVGAQANEIRLDRTELDEAAWFALSKALEETKNPFAKRGLEIVAARAKQAAGAGPKG